MASKTCRLLQVSVAAKVTGRREGAAVHHNFLKRKSIPHRHRPPAFRLKTWFGDCCRSIH